MFNKEKSKIKMTCPLCGSDAKYRFEYKFNKDKIIYSCRTCKGYFIYPMEKIEYNDSHWSKKRIENWENDVERARKYIPGFMEYCKGLIGKKPETVLEIGCGTGYMGEAFREKNCCYTGIDVDNVMVEFGKRKGLSVYERTIEEIDYFNMKYDLIFSSNVFEHLPFPLESMKTLSKINSEAIIIIVPNAHGFSSLVKKNRIVSFVVKKIWGYTKDCVYTIDGEWHNIAYTKSTLKYLCEKSGIEILKLKKITTNDNVFGFVQPQNSLFFRLFTLFTQIIGMPNSLCLICRPE